ncbi:MAG: hypothetical protein ND866_06170 [Pyrinomonadaceae bacterium]|nr:hypothetical protein [Pyrinomonadaceae bacterium]
MSAEAVSLAPPSEANKKTTWTQDLYKVVIPSVVTAVFGFVIWNAQAKIEHKVTSSNQILQSQMALKEEFYKRRLTKYEDACKSVTDVRHALDEAVEAAPESQSHAMEKLAALETLNKSNALYWSDDMDKRLGTLWSLGIDKLRYRQFADKTANDNIRNEISGLFRQMKDDLAVKEMSRLPQHHQQSE